jgi:hypothetical protein
MSADPEMVADDVHEHLSTHNRGFLITRRADGSPTCHPMGSYYADRSLYFNMYASSVKHRNLVRDPQTTVLLTSPSDSEPLVVAMWRGEARLMPHEEILSPEAPRGVVKARAMGLEGVTDESQAPDKFAREDADDLKKRVAVMKERIRDGVRVLWHIVPSRVGWLSDLRAEGK